MLRGILCKLIMNEIFLIKQNNYSQSEIDNAILRAFNHFGGIKKFINKNEKVLLKVNLVAGHAPEKRISTDPSIVKSVAKLVLDLGAKPFIADSPGIDNFSRASEKAGFKKIADELNIPCHELDNPVEVPHVEGVNFNKIKISQHVLNADKIINLPKMKTHGQMLLTLGVKNLFGCIPGKLKASWHYNVGLNRVKFASLLLDLNKIIKPSITILDGVIGMHGDGPTSGEPYNYGLIAATTNPLKMDFHLCKMMGANLNDYPLWLAAKEQNLPECNINPQDLEGDFNSDFVFEGVEIPKTKSMRLIPNIPFLERLMTSKPVHIPEKCIGCGRCQEVCAAHALKHENKKLFFDYSKCIRCYCCHEMCPVKAIKFHESFLLKLLAKF